MIAACLSIGLVLVVLAGLLVLLRGTARRDPELARKCVHVGMGLVTLAFPWLFDAAWPVVLLALAASAFFVALRAHASLRRELGCTLHGVARPSCGEFHFVAGTCVVFVLAEGSAVPFGIAMLVLTFADTAAALAGRRFAHKGAGGGKTIVGSGAFLLVALTCVYAPLAALTDAGPGTALGTAVIVALVTTMLEASARHGLDNLLVPLGAYATLVVLGHGPAARAGSEASAALALLAAIALPLLALVASVPRTTGGSAWKAR